MPYAIDEDKLRDAKTLDLNKPPLKPIPHMEFPKMVYLHPKDKTREHMTKLVNDSAELEEALKRGYKRHAHIPVVSDLPEGYEFVADIEPEATAKKK